ncbi:unnamed protein product [Zymoseptoria tritici ST99CH_1E4]|uniref:Importin N-terminal domain-containing protein n=1 Tax=Zymoseptoria tritici ST99CH_1E4 TaxID=1276532 RepID=A0A2H1H9R4_ZYMTR|nr:unnamed protein product [Zymoseptoria tritici ST99CH_1E4]
MPDKEAETTVAALTRILDRATESIATFYDPGKRSPQSRTSQQPSSQQTSLQQLVPAQLPPALFLAMNFSSSRGMMKKKSDARSAPPRALSARRFAPPTPPARRPTKSSFSPPASSSPPNRRARPAKADCPGSAAAHFPFGQDVVEKGRVWALFGGDCAGDEFGVTLTTDYGVFAIEVPGEANPLTESSIVRTLQPASSSNQNQIQSGTKQLQQWEKSQKYYCHLQSAYLDPRLPAEVRYLASIQLKNGIDLGFIAGGEELGVVVGKDEKSGLGLLVRWRIERMMTRRRGSK